MLAVCLRGLFVPGVLNVCVVGCVLSGFQCDGTAEDTLCHRNFTSGEECGVSARAAGHPKPELSRTGTDYKPKNKQLNNCI